MPTKDFLLPDLGEGLTEAEVLRWLVAVGDTVAQDQLVAEVETEKAVVEVPSPFAGTVVALHVEEGQELQVGQPLLSIDVGAGSPPEEAEVSDMVPEPGAGVPAPADEDQEGESGSVLVGYGTGEETRSRRRRRVDDTGSSRPPQPHRPRAKPPVRKLAKDLGVDLADVNGSGPDGLVTREDVEAAARTVEATPTEAGVLVTDARHQRLGSAPPLETAERVPLRGVRKAIAEKMATSRQEIPEATTWVDCDATRLWKLRRRLSEAQPEVQISLLAIILRACVAGLREFPSLNSMLDVERGEIVLHRHVNLGFAAATDRGLVVPVIKDAHRMSMLQIAAELGRLAQAARDGSVTPAELTGGTFTVSNYGSFGVDGGSPVINFPEAAILGVGRVTDRPWVYQGKVKPRKVVQLSIAFDHRICDGADAAGFLRLIADCIERPTTLLSVL